MTEIKFSKKHKLKEDHFIERVFEVGQWVQQNAKQVFTAAIIALAVLGAGFLYIQSQKNKSTKGQETFGNAMISFESGDTASAMTDFETVMKSYGGTSYACMSAFLLGNIYYNKRDYVQAQNYYKENTKKYKSYELFCGASLRGLGNCAIQEQQYDKAIEYFENFVKDYSKHYLAAEVLLSLGECYLKTGKKEEATMTFKKLTTGAYAQTPQAENAKRLMAAL